MFSGDVSVPGAAGAFRPLFGVCDWPVPHRAVLRNFTFQRNNRCRDARLGQTRPYQKTKSSLKTIGLFTHVYQLLSLIPYRNYFTLQIIF